MLIALVWAVALPVAAKSKVIPEADAAALQGKTVALTVHERPGFSAMTAGKVMFGGAIAMAIAGNNLIRENDVQDPAVVLRTQLASALANAYGAQILPVDTVPTKAKKPKDLAALHPEADYVLDVRSTSWNSAYFPLRWGNYWVQYVAEVQLIDARTKGQVGSARCIAHTRDNPKAPTREQLEGNGAQLLKDVTTSLGWECVQKLAREQFRVPADKIAATPVAYVDPYANMVQLDSAGNEKAAKSGATAAPAAAQATDAAAAAPAPAEATEVAAPAQAEATGAAAPETEATEAAAPGSGSGSN